MIDFVDDWTEDGRAFVLDALEERLGKLLFNKLKLKLYRFFLFTVSLNKSNYLTLLFKSLGCRPIATATT